MPRIKYEEKRFSPERLAISAQANTIVTEWQAKGLDLTLRQVYYQFVARDWFPASWADPETGSTNNDKSYDKLGDIVADGRLAGLIDWNAIVDRTRKVRGNSHWESPEDIIEACAQSFQIDKWKNQKKYVEVWVEKDALIGILEAACSPLDVPYYSCRGYNSHSEIWNAAYNRLRPRMNHGNPHVAKKCVILYMGDHDPSGIQMRDNVEQRLRQFSMFESGVTVERIALNRDQVDEYNPPENPVKMTDSRSAAYVAEHGQHCWELDAIDPDVLIELITERVKAHRSESAWLSAKHDEREHKKALFRISQGFDKAKAAVKNIEVTLPDEEEEEDVPDLFDDMESSGDS
jgi:hypothetical protein